MRRLCTWVLLFSLALLTAGIWACFSPDLGAVRFTCTGDGLPEDCPSGYQCRERLCLLPGEPLPDLASPSDSGPADQAPPPPDLATASGCASGQGYAVGQAFACPGTFGGTGKGASTLCASGYRLCRKTAGHLGTADLKACRLLPGMYIGDVIGSYQVDPGQAVCDGTQPRRQVFGCGKNSRSLSAGVKCGGFEQVVDFTANTTQMTAPAGMFSSVDLINNPSPTDGALCCLPTP